MATGASSSGVINTGDVQLGQNTTLKVGTIKIGNRSNGTVAFAAGLTNPQLTLRGIDEPGAVTSLEIGAAGANPGASTTSTLDLTGGSLDAKIGTLNIGHKTIYTDSVTGQFYMGAGTLDVAAINLAKNTRTSGTSTATFSLDGGTVNATTLTMAHRDGVSGGTVTANFTLKSGVFNATTIERANAQTPE